MVHAKRGRQAIEAMEVLSAFTGIATHDAWAPYDLYAAAEHQLCCAHVLRELQAVTDAAAPARRTALEARREATDVEQRPCGSAPGL